MRGDTIMRHSRQMSESMELGIILTLAGGFMDAYSYMCRDHVFANAQTGNILLIGIHLSNGNFGAALRYFVPVIAFATGIMVSDMIRILLKHWNLMHWRQCSVICEALVLFSVGFLPQSQNHIANSLISSACGIQVESFRKIHGNGIATTMCIGNLRGATQHICEYWHTKDKSIAKKGILYYSIIFIFVLGAVIGNQFVQILKEKAIFICSGFLFLAFIMMFIDREHISPD